MKRANKKTVSSSKPAVKTAEKPKTSHSHLVDVDMAPWWQRLTAENIVRGLLLFFAATLPLYYDLTVPEVSGDIRWAATSVFAGLTALILLGNAAFKGQGTLNLRWPPILWFGLGLAIWAAVSLIDALNWTRGIILLKAMYAQLILMVVVYHVATPRFGRQLLWALVLPLFITSIIGMWQFQDMTDAGLAKVMDDNLFFMLFKPLVWVGDWIVQIPIYILDWQDRQLGVAGFVKSYFLQSAVPGSTFANKNLAGSWTAMMLPIALYLLLTAKRWPAQAFASLLLGLGSVFLVYSRARASWVAFFAAMLTLGALVLIVPAWRKAVWRHLDMSHLWWLVLPVAMLGYWGRDISPVTGSYAIDRSPAQQVAALAGSSWNEIGGRLAYNLNSTQIVKDYWLNGVGLGNFYTIYPPYYGAVVVTPWNSYNVMARPQRTHTDMMQSFDEMGIPGGILYTGLFVLGIAMALRLGGRAAGGFGGYVIGAGMMTMILALTLFLEYQQMLMIPEPWNLVVQGLMTLFIGGMLAGAWYRGRQAQDDQAPADDVQLMGLMAGISVLCISINALMDFPMQLPTAPAATLMILGLIAGIYASRHGGAKWGPKIAVHTGRAGAIVLLVVIAGAWAWALRDAYYFRLSNQMLKQGMIRIYSNVVDDTTLSTLEKAYDTYPYDQRIVEHLGVAYANYQGSRPLDVKERIRKTEWVLKSDPWGANHLINLAGLYLQVVAIDNNFPEKAAERQAALERLEEIFGRLQRNADFSHFTWGIGGMIRLEEKRYDDALWMFRRALAIEPGYTPAQFGIQRIISESGMKPAVVQDGIVKP